MAITYTDNLHLGMQLDKTDYLNWDAITENWRKIDAAVGSITPGGGASIPSDAQSRYFYGASNVSVGMTGTATYEQEQGGN